MQELFTDVRYGVRNLVSHPGFTAAAALTLALGLGANTAIFSVVDAVVLTPLPYAEPERLAMMWETNLAKGLDHERLSPVNFLDYRALDQVVEDAAAWWHPDVNLVDDEGEPIRVTTIETSGNLFAVLGVEPVMGRAFDFAEGLHGEEREVVIGHGLWSRRYGRDPAVLGTTIQLNERPFEIVGVMPEGFSFPGDTEVWQRLGWDLAGHSRYAHFMEAVFRLRPGTGEERAQAELDALTARLAVEEEATNKDWGARLVSLEREVLGDTRTALLVLLGAVGLLLLLACANVANLLLARASSRNREVAMRSALGAGRGRLLRQFLTESLLLAAAGAALGTGLAWTAVRLLTTLVPLDIPRLEAVALDGRVLLFTLAATAFTALAFGTVPALAMSDPDLQGALKEGGRSTAGGLSGTRTRRLLVVAEVALAVMLLVGAGLLIRSFLRLLGEDSGFRPAGVMSMNVQLPYTAYQEWPQVAQFFDRLLTALEEHPAIEAAGATGFLPLDPGWRILYTLPDRPPPEPGEEPTAQYVTVTPGTLETLGIPLLGGRLFNRFDTADSPPVVVVNRELARRAWPDEPAVGRRLAAGTRGIGPLGRSLVEGSEYEVVGVVGDVKNDTLGTAAESAIYFVHTQFPYRSMSLVVRGAGSADQLTGVVREEVRRLDAGLPLAEVRSLDEILAAASAPARFFALAMSGFAALALLLAAVGIYGVLSYAVSQRRGEIGVRLALGASPGTVRRLVVGEGMLLAGVGLALGAAAAFALSRLLASLLYGVGGGDVVTFGAVPALLLAVALASCYLPARRAAAVDPATALRVDQ